MSTQTAWQRRGHVAFQMAVFVMFLLGAGLMGDQDGSRKQEFAVGLTCAAMIVALWVSYRSYVSREGIEREAYRDAVVAAAFGTQVALLVCAVVATHFTVQSGTFIWVILGFWVSTARIYAWRLRRLQ